jgi:hypothetical protein
MNCFLSYTKHCAGVNGKIKEIKLPKHYPLHAKQTDVNTLQRDVTFDDDDSGADQFRGACA